MLKSCVFLHKSNRICVCVCVYVSKDLDNWLTNMVLFYCVASYSYFVGGYPHPSPKNSSPLHFSFLFETKIEKSNSTPYNSSAPKGLLGAQPLVKIISSSWDVIMAYRGEFYNAPRGLKRAYLLVKIIILSWEKDVIMLFRGVFFTMLPEASRGVATS